MFYLTQTGDYICMCLRIIPLVPQLIILSYFFQGAVPATIGVIGGRIKVGLTEEELCLLADVESKAVKVSRRDLPLVVAKQLYGGTTVAATMVIAHKAGIPVFVTGKVVKLLIISENLIFPS